MIKIHEKSVLVGIKMETRKRTPKNIAKYRTMSKMDPKIGAQTRSFFGHLAPFFCARRPWEPKWLPSPPQEPPRPVQASISIDFGLILDDFLMIFCIWFASLLFWLPRAFIFKFLATSSNELGSSAGVSKVTKKCDFAYTKTHTPTGRWM